ncbi:MAG: hypothetical protein J0H01_30700 [Rhizobiales bacterium]|nr:hypothetical protein [Hyphomicrobiales bacterium]
MRIVAITEKTIPVSRHADPAAPGGAMVADGCAAPPAMPGIGFEAHGEAWRQYRTLLGDLP